MSAYKKHIKSYESIVVPQRFLNPAKDTAKLISEFYKSGSASLLDLGTGTGVVLEAIKDLQPNIELFGLDNSSAMLERCREKDIATLVQSNLPVLPFPDNRFDFITANFVLSHVHDHMALINGISRILKNEGHFVFALWAEGQKEYNTLFNKILKKYVSQSFCNRIYQNFLPNEATFENSSVVEGILVGQGLRHKKTIKKSYSLNLDLEEYLVCRYNLLLANQVRGLLADNIWQELTDEMYKEFNQLVGDRIRYKGSVNFFVFEKENNPLFE